MKNPTNSPWAAAPGLVYRFASHGLARAFAPGLPWIRSYAARARGNRHYRKLLGPARWGILAALALGVVAFELRTSWLQSRIFSRYARRLSYQVQSGASGQIVFPRGGPFDGRRGYTRIPEFQARLAAQGFRVTE